MAEKVAVPITKYYLSGEVKGQIIQALQSQGMFIPGQFEAVFNSLEKTGKLPDEIPRYGSAQAIPGINELASKAKPFHEGVVEEIGKYKSRESNLTVPEYQQYIGLIEAANAGNKEGQTQTKEQFKQEVISRLASVVDDPGLVETLAEKAADKYVVKRETGDIALTDFVAREGGLNLDAVRSALEPLNQNLGSYLNKGEATGEFNNELARVNSLYTKAQAAETETNRQKQQMDLAEGQRVKSDLLFQQAISTLAQPTPTFTSQYSPEFLQHLQQSIIERGNTSLSNVEAQQQARGLTGSSIEAYALGQEEGNIVDALANQTFQFLAKSGESGQQNKEFLARSLLSQAQAYLGAGQQTESLVTNRELTSQDLALNRDKLATQIAQFNAQLQETGRQFNEGLATQQKTAGENLALLMQQLSQRKSGAGNYTQLGALGGAGLGALLAVPTGGLSIGAGALLGGAGGGFLGGLGDIFG